MSDLETDVERPLQRQKQALVAFGCGLLFAVGLGLAGLTSPAKVLGFLDVTSSAWDPTLAFVMAAAIGVHFLFARRAAAASAEGRAPTLADRYHLPEQRSIDRSLVGGAALFGVGWGLAGYCPGPGIVAFIVTPTAVIFVGAMLAGMWGTRVVRERLHARAADRAIAIELERELTRALAPAARSNANANAAKRGKKKPVVSS